MTKRGRPRIAERVAVTCPQCGTETERPAWDPLKFCDRKCFLAYKAEHRKPKPARAEREPKLCIMGDGKRQKGRGYCEMHLLRVRKYGDPNVVRKKQPKPLEERVHCSVEGCGSLAAAKGLCRNHYMRAYRRGGDPAVLAPRGVGYSTPISTRTHMWTVLENGCWEWNGAANRHGVGYGQTAVQGKAMLAHRAMYEELIGPIGFDADGQPLTLDHLCGNESCVNPDHLDPCTSRENKFRGGEPHFELRGKAAHYD